ncbi:TlpA disulfide reductase family protein [Runella sp. SP2]|uniref:TlpA disulfide reductase family protein n=1 Tax=Runella sp. SP2 TaxID=2268026 RepID=UPI000F095593|nr:TlpA disulfide reductase family protein [Runella sp. SP2]AYQ34965.1 AhpC/TSA family protein [Runella sp. SP2]
MRSLLFLLVLLEYSELSAQNLTGKCPNIKSGKVYVINQSNETIDSVRIVNECFVVTSKLREPSLFTLRSSAFDGEVYLVLEKNRPLSIEINPRGEVKYLINTLINVSFQKVHKDYINFQQQILKLSPSVDSLDNDSLMSLRSTAYTQFIQKITDFIVQKSANQVSALVLFEIVHLSNLLPVNELKKRFDMLSEAVKKSSYGQKISEYLIKEFTLREGNIAPEFELVDVENKVHKLSDYRGRYVLLHFWASWCGPCRGENKEWPMMMPVLSQLPVTIIHVSQDSEKKEWLKAIKADGLECFIHVLNTKGKKGDVVYDYQISGIPDNVLISPDGTIKQKKIRWTDLEKLVK